MVQQLIYNIAEHLIVIETPDAAQTRALFPSFEVFEHNLPFTNDNDVLFRFRRVDVIATTSEMVFLETIAFENTVTNIFKTERGYLIVSKIGDRVQKMNTSHDLSVFESDVSVTEPDADSFLVYFVTMAFNLAIAKTNTLKIHASVIEKDGYALLFMGKSGTGKSTHSRLWQKYVEGCTLLNDDAPIMRYFDNGDVIVYGSPWSGKTPCYRNVKANIKAFVHLYQSKENRLTKMSLLESISSLLFSTVTFKSNKENRDAVFDTLSKILQRVSVYRLDCRPDEEAVRLTESLLIT